MTNVPGPQFPLYMLGREMEAIVPVAFLPENHALAVAIMSYNGKLDFGLLGDYDAMQDLERFGGHLEDCLAELLTAAKKADRKRASSNGSAKSGAQRKGDAQRKAPAALQERLAGAVLGHELERELERALVHADGDELAVARVLGQQRVAHLLPAWRPAPRRPPRRWWPGPSRGRAPRTPAPARRAPAPRR